MKMIEMDIKTFKGIVPTGYDLVVYEKEGDPLNGMVLYDFSEVGDFDNYYIEPVYCFLGTYLTQPETECV